MANKYTQAKWAEASTLEDSIMIIKRTEFILSVKLVCCINRQIAASQLPPLARIRNKCIMTIIFMLQLFIGFVSLYSTKTFQCKLATQPNDIC